MNWGQKGGEREFGWAAKGSEWYQINRRETDCAWGINVLFYNGFGLYIVDGSTLSRANYEIS